MKNKAIWTAIAISFVTTLVALWVASEIGLI